MNALDGRSAETNEVSQFPRRHFLVSLLAPGLWRPGAVVAGLQSKKQDSALPIRVSTLNHVSFGCDDLRNTVQWYGRVFGMPVHAFQDYAGGQTVLRIGNGPAYVALSQRNQKSIGQPPTRLPHFCWGVQDFNVDRILRALSEMQAPAQAVLREGKTINGVNFDDPDGFPLQFNPLNACGGGGFLGDVCDTSARAARQPGDPPPIPVRTLNHVKLIVPNVQRTLEWYLKLTGMQRQADQEPRGGPRTPGYEGPPIPILRVGSGPQFVALVEGTGPAAFRPHVGFGVQGFVPDRIVQGLAEHGVKARTRLREGATVEILIDAPDGIEIQLQDISYCGGRGPLGNMCG
jgi:catechol 2,3-dioxygenase-like lactoylglutathione lyase family enzyme